MTRKKSIKTLAEELAEDYGVLPIHILMDFAVNDPDKAVRLDAAKAAAPYVHAKLKQVEISEQPAERTPDQVEADIASFLAGLIGNGGGGEAGETARERAARLVGDAGGTGRGPTH